MERQVSVVPAVSCLKCGEPLAGRQRKYCSRACKDAFRPMERRLERERSRRRLEELAVACIRQNNRVNELAKEVLLFLEKTA